MTDQEIASVVAFFKTLTGADVYTNEKWSDPFDQDGQIEVLYMPTSVQDLDFAEILISPNPAISEINIKNLKNLSKIEILDISGQLINSVNIENKSEVNINVSILRSGLYIVLGKDETTHQLVSQKFIKI